MTKSNLRIWNLKYIVTFFGHNSYLPLLKFCTLHSIFCNFNSELTAINIYGLNCVHFYDPFYCQIAIKRKYWSVERLVNYISFFQRKSNLETKVNHVTAVEKCLDKVEKILKGSLDLIPSPSAKIQIMGGKVCLRCKGKTLLGVVNKLLKTHHPTMFCLITLSKLFR